ncbi:MAG TPA: bifunctional 3-deoxy-7-phosphoheptulonate synthase/chorismate mutase type II [Chitinophagaceae bacterium]|nr:bifunctional 3-deoxy-7-phosphoheptulonate synthase/chorismate mutase type II [Chitinophagaceae bacterium]
MNVFATHKPFIIAGPCGVENEHQLPALAKRFESMNVHMMRAGVWKPRSKPGFFEGRGELALQWIQELRKESPLRVCIEVANQEQVALALQYGVDAMWIGARTTVNPFMVQEIAEALKNTQVAVLIKNPINPDIELWSGAIERIQQAGITDIAAIHRGFSSYDPGSKYRNKPNWAIPIELKRRYKELPIICDASHICGNRPLIPAVAQRALDLDFDGLMLETHPHPDQALSDANQQLTPDQLQEILTHLQLRTPIDDSYQQEIEQIRQILDSMDAEVVDMIGKRLETVEKLAAIKGQNNMPIYQTDRWREIVETRTVWGQQNQLSKEFILSLFELIHDESIRRQIQVLKQSSE